MLRSGDYILVTDTEHKRYLQIGEVIDIDYYPYDNFIQLYRVRFVDGVDEYDWHFERCYKRLIVDRN